MEGGGCSSPLGFLSLGNGTAGDLAKDVTDKIYIFICALPAQAWTPVSRLLQFSSFCQSQEDKFSSKHICKNADEHSLSALTHTKLDIDS